MNKFASAFLLLAITCAVAQAADEVVYDYRQPGFYRPTIELIKFCFENGLASEGRKLRALVLRDAAKSKEAEAAEALGKDVPTDRADNYSAKSWGDYLDKREAIGAGRAAAAMKALGDQGAMTAIQFDTDNAQARKVLGDQWLDGLGWLDAAGFERLKPLCIKLADATDKAPRDATWNTPYVLVGASFALVTDLP